MGQLNISRVPGTVTSPEPPIAGGGVTRARDIIDLGKRLVPTMAR